MTNRFSIKIHPASFALFTAVFLFADSHLAIAAMLALAIHEGAHVLAMVLCGFEGCKVEITPFGGMMDEKSFDRYPPWKQFLTAGAGVAVSGAAAWCCKQLMPNTLFIQRCFQANLSLVVMNLLPVWPLDGARMIKALAAYAGLEYAAKRLLSFLSVIVGVLLTVLGLYGAWKGIMNPTLLVAGPYLCYASRTEMVTSRVRRLGNADQSLKTGKVLPVSLSACSEEYLYKQFASHLACGGDNHYQILAAIDPATGSVQKWWTEHEILNHLLSEDRN